jgi:hypothetical protein
MGMCPDAPKIIDATAENRIELGNIVMEEIAEPDFRSLFEEPRIIYGGRHP